MKRPGLLSLALIVFGLGSTLISCKGNGMKERPAFQQGVYRSKAYVGCSYAIYRYPFGGRDDSVLYYLHGAGGDENTWAQANQELIASWEQAKTGPSTVVALTFGKEWLVFPEGTAVKGVSQEKICTELIPEIEKALADGYGIKIQRRLLYGFSIGGANVAQLFFRNPELFNEAVIVSGQLFSISIFSSNDEIDALAAGIPWPVHGPIDWIKENVLHWGGAARSMRKELEYIRGYVPVPAGWEKANILLNMKAALTDSKRRVYISCGDEDTCFSGAETLAAAARARGYETIFKPLEGGHMVIDERGIATFLED